MKSALRRLCAPPLTAVIGSPQLSYQPVPYPLRRGRLEPLLKKYFQSDDACAWRTDKVRDPIRGLKYLPPAF